MLAWQEAEEAEEAERLLLFPFFFSPVHVPHVCLKRRFTATADR